MKKRGVWFIFISIWTGLFLLLWIGSVLYTIGIMLDSNVELTNPVAEILAYHWIAALCLSIAFFGLMKMIFQLRKAGYIIYTISLILTLIDLIILKVRMDERMAGLTPESGPTIIIVEVVLIIVYILIFLPAYFSKLRKKQKRVKSSDLSIQTENELVLQKIVEEQKNQQPTQNVDQQEFNQEATKIESRKTVDKNQETILTKLKKNGKKYLLIGIGGIILIGGIFGLFYFYNQKLHQQNVVNEQRIVDSIRVADSITMVHAEQQRIADSIAITQEIIKQLRAFSLVGEKYSCMNAVGTLLFISSDSVKGFQQAYEFASEGGEDICTNKVGFYLGKLSQNQISGTFFSDPQWYNGNTLPDPIQFNMTIQEKKLEISYNNGQVYKFQEININDFRMWSKSKVDLRETSASTSKIVTEIPINKELKIIEIGPYIKNWKETGFWIKVCYSDYSGWVFGDSLTFQDPSSPTQDPNYQ